MTRVQRQCFHRIFVPIYNIIPLFLVHKWNEIFQIIFWKYIYITSSDIELREIFFWYRSNVKHYTVIQFDHLQNTLFPSTLSNLYSHPTINSSRQFFLYSFKYYADLKTRKFPPIFLFTYKFIPISRQTLSFSLSLEQTHLSPSASSAKPG